jgi:hypothetical protein
MLYWLLFETLFPHFSPFRVFQYATFRTAFASMTALFLSIVANTFARKGRSRITRKRARRPWEEC